MLTIRRYFESKLGQIRWKGDQGTAICPFHHDRHPSLSVNAAKGLFCCHACDAKGGLVEFERRISGCDIKTARHRIAKLANRGGGSNQEAGSSPFTPTKIKKESCATSKSDSTEELPFQAPCRERGMDLESGRCGEDSLSSSRSSLKPIECSSRKAKKTSKHFEIGASLPLAIQAVRASGGRNIRLF